MKKNLPISQGNPGLVAKTQKKSFLIAIALLLFSLSGFAHAVTGYTGGCITGPKYSLDATVTNVNSSSNYAWQYKNASGAWVCIVNGNNTINGFVYSVSGALSTLTTNPAPIVFNNPNINLHGLIIRCVISDGSGVNPCNMPSGNTWNSNSSSVNHTISVSGSSCGGSTCNASISNIYFNKLDGGADITITNGATYTTTQLGSLYNLEASATGTVGSVKFTITGPTASSNIENAVPYNSPGTGSGAWVGAPGSYTVNVKVYSGADGTGTVCDEENRNFTVSNDCSCPGNVLTNPSFENTATGWSVSGGTLTFGTSYEMCGTYNGFLNWSSGTAKLWQDVTVAAGSVLSFKGYAGTHNPGLACSPKLSLIFYNSANAVISQADATVTWDVGSGNQLALYTINATAPAGTVKVRVQGSITCNTLKVDGFCLTIVSPPASLGDLVWEDYNRNGLQDAGEPGIAGATVVLKDGGGNTVGTTTTDANGIYSFTNLAPGTYSVTFTTPATYIPTPSNIGPDDTKDSDPIDGVAGGIGLSGGQNNLSIDAGFYRLINLSGNVWHDVNGMNDNQVNNTGPSQTPPASAIPVGLRAYLVNSATGLIVRSTIVSSATGTFGFNDISPNTTYRVYVSSVVYAVGSPEPNTPTIIPSGWEHTGQKFGITPGSDGINDGRLTVPVGVNSVINVNFGIKVSGGDVVTG